MTQRKKEPYIRTNITVPKSLHSQMHELREINWSAVATQAFRAKVAELLKTKVVESGSVEDEIRSILGQIDGLLNRLADLTT